MELASWMLPAGNPSAQSLQVRSGPRGSVRPRRSQRRRAKLSRPLAAVAVEPCSPAPRSLRAPGYRERVPQDGRSEPTALQIIPLDRRIWS